MYRLYFLLTGPVQLNTSANGLRETAKNFFGNHVGSQLLFSDLVSNACSTNKWTLQRGCYQTVALRDLWAISLVLHSYLLLNGQRDRFAANTVLHTGYCTSQRREHVSVQGSQVDGASHSLTYWLTEWRTDWLVECLWQFECLMKWLAVCLWTTGCLGDRFDEWTADWMDGWLTDWNTESGWLFGWLFDWLN